MTVRIHNGQWAGLLIGLAFLCMSSAQAAEATNLWQSVFGQNWFYESRSGSGQTLAGTAWESSLEPGNTYQVSFQVNNLRGRAALQVGERNISVDRTGQHSYEFRIWAGSKRRMQFVTRSSDVTAGINNITVQPRVQASAGTATGMPKGHYLTFARERNLLHNVMRLVDDPSRAPSGWHLALAHDAHDALTTPGVRGFSVNVGWRTLEPGDGRYDWSLLDANMAVARRLGLKYIINVSTRGYHGEDVIPRYFPARYKIWSQGNGKSGFVAAVWDPWVRDRLIRLYRRIAARYANNPAFGGIATSETALGNFSGGNYTLAAYRTALQRIAAQTQQALSRGKLFWYLNYVRGGAHGEMRTDARVRIANSVPHHSLVLGAPDITPDLAGVPGSLSSYRVHMRKTRPHLEQFCHMQHVDQGLGGINRKTNRHRRAFLDRVRRVREREQQPWFNGPTAIFEFDDLRNPAGRSVNLHPNWVVGQLWTPGELFQFANRNFDCDYFFWHYRENVHNLSSQFWWDDIRPLIVNNRSL